MGARRIDVVGSYGGVALELALGSARLLVLGVAMYQNPLTTYPQCGPHRSNWCPGALWEGPWKQQVTHGGSHLPRNCRSLATLWALQGAILLPGGFQGG